MLTPPAACLLLALEADFTALYASSVQSYEQLTPAASSSRGTKTLPSTFPPPLNASNLGFTT
eukprot:756372-Hanusia_phi.AAC.2